MKNVYKCTSCQFAGLPATPLLLASNTTPKLSSQSNSEDAMTSSNTTEARLAAGTELAGLGYYEVDYGQRTCFLDDRFREICGVPPEVQQGLEPVAFWLAHIHPDDRQRVSDERQALHEGTLHKTSTEYRYLHPTQGQRWIHHLARIAERSAIEGEVRIFGVIRDITEQHRSEEAIHDLSARLIAAQEEERARLARELHDGLSQSLALQAVQLDLMAQRPPPTAAEFASRMQELSAQMKSLSTEVHRISHDLHPAKLTQLGLAAAIAELCHAGLSVHQIPISFHHRGIPRSLPLGVVYRTPDWEDFVCLAVTEIRQFGGTSIQVARRLRAMLENLTEILPPERTAVLRSELKLLQRSRPAIFSRARRPGSGGT